MLHFPFHEQNSEWQHLFGGTDGANVAVAVATRRDSLPALQRPKSPLGKTFSLPVAQVSKVLLIQLMNTSHQRFNLKQPRTSLPNKWFELNSQ